MESNLFDGHKLAWRADRGRTGVTKGRVTTATLSSLFLATATLIAENKGQKRCSQPRQPAPPLPPPPSSRPFPTTSSCSASEPSRSDRTSDRSLASSVRKPLPGLLGCVLRFFCSFLLVTVRVQSKCPVCRGFSFCSMER
jgi:hypothetical protein